MASYHFSVKPVSRAKGRSATGAAAYRAADRILDERTGELFDFRRKRGVEYCEILLPAGAPAWAGYRAQLWNAVERCERRKNSTVAREFEIALPAELGPGERRELAVRFARELIERHRFAADLSIHQPSRRGDQRNHHVHILCSTRRLTPEGFEAKTRELDDLKTGPVEVTRWRERWAELQNEWLAEHGHAARVDHRSLEAQGLDREPTRHKGPAITAMERRGLETNVGYRFTEERRLEAQGRLERAAEAGRLEREHRELNRSILDLSGDLALALRDRQHQETPVSEASVSPPAAAAGNEGLSVAERLRAAVEQRAGELAAERQRDRPKKVALERERAEKEKRRLELDKQRELARKKDWGLER